ncbi:DUF2336 domain-containing protein [Siculibacillus lacustris]|nr:DUF2336 domain-containing protein [Siculibacillus lacustris]
MVLDRFFLWIGEASVEGRIAAVAPLVRAHRAGELDEATRETAEAALTLVAHDEEVVVRRRLAEVLCEAPGAPRHLLQSLLDDHPDVAEVVAGRSPDLIDPELVALVATCDERVRAAVADRPRVGPTVAVALAAVVERPSALRLLANPGADLPPPALESLVERFGDFADLREALMSRPDVPIVLRHRVLEKLAEAIGRHVVDRALGDSARVAEVTRDAKDRATVALAGRADGDETAALVEHLRASGQLTTRLLLRAACVGDLRFVEESFAVLAGLPAARVAALLADGRRTGLRALHTRAGLPERAYPVLVAALEVHRDLARETGGLDGRPGDGARFARRLVERVLTRYTAFERRDADDLLVLLRRFAADAGRDHMRAVMTAHRDAAEARRLAPPAEPAVAALAPATAQPQPESPPAADPVAPIVAVAAPAPAFEEEAIDEPWGLFSHVRPEDLPAHWLAADEDVGESDRVLASMEGDLQAALRAELGARPSERRAA